jgi:hypothetical protein
VAYENNDKRIESVFSTRIKAGKRRTYFFDVRPTKANDYYLTITESCKKFDNGGGYERHKIFVYKEDFNKFIKAFTEAVDHVKTELMPDFDFDSFNHDQEPDFEYRGDAPAQNGNTSQNSYTQHEQPAPPSAPQFSDTGDNGANESVDKW